MVQRGTLHGDDDVPEAKPRSPPRAVGGHAYQHGTTAGSAPRGKPTSNQEARGFGATRSTHFVAPWARGHGLARTLVEAVEVAARVGGFETLNLDVRETQKAALKLYESCGYERWGTLQSYARVDGRMISGHCYVKRFE